jgi:hypothetical protein
MLCDFLKPLSASQLLTHDRIVERIELETPQILFIIWCEKCRALHSIEFSANDGEPKIPARHLKEAA